AAVAVSRGARAAAQDGERFFGRGGPRRVNEARSLHSRDFERLRQQIGDLPGRAALPCLQFADCDRRASHARGQITLAQPQRFAPLPDNLSKGSFIIHLPRCFFRDATWNEWCCALRCWQPYFTRNTSPISLLLTMSFIENLRGADVTRSRPPSV